VTWLALVVAKIKSGTASLSSGQSSPSCSLKSGVYGPLPRTDNSISFHGDGSEKPFSHAVLNFSFSEIMRKVSGVVKKARVVQDQKRKKQKCILLPCCVLQHNL